VKNFEVIVLGAGSAGELVATNLARSGKSVALIEKLRVGGECAYVSCMPSKAMLRSAQIRNLAKQSVQLGSSQKPLELGDDLAAFDIAAMRRDTIAEYRDDRDAAIDVEKSGATLIRGTGQITGPGEIFVNGERYTWGDLVIATGSKANIPEILGISEIDYWTSDVALSVASAPRSVMIIGGGPVGCELSQIFSSFGAKVTLVEFSSQLASKEHPEIAARLFKVLTDSGINVLLNVKVESVKKIAAEITLVSLSDKSSIEVERVIIAAGRHPNTSDIGLAALKIIPSKSGAIEIDAQCRVVGQNNVWAAGDVTGVAPYTHTANYQGEIISRNLMGGSAVANYNAIPRVIYTEPAVASVGVFQNENQSLISASFDLADLARSETDGQMGGLLILTADPARGVLVGAAAIGPHADEWLAEATLAIRAQVPLSILCDVVHAFPTYGQSLEAPLEELLSRSLSAQHQ
jgi:dihydrolipoamide dehydrogenase